MERVFGWGSRLRSRSDLLFVALFPPPSCRLLALLQLGRWGLHPWVTSCGVWKTLAGSNTLKPSWMRGPSSPGYVPTDSHWCLTKYPSIHVLLLFFRGAHWLSSQVMAGVLLKKRKRCGCNHNFKILFLAGRYAYIKDVSEKSQKF